MCYQSQSCKQILHYHFAVVVCSCIWSEHWEQTAFSFPLGWIVHIHFSWHCCLQAIILPTDPDASSQVACYKLRYFSPDVCFKFYYNPSSVFPSKSVFSIETMWECKANPQLCADVAGQYLLKHPSQLSSSFFHSELSGVLSAATPHCSFCLCLSLSNIMPMLMGGFL